MPITFLPDHAKDSGLTPEHSVILISVMSVANSVSRIFTGWVADRRWSNTVLIRSTTFIITGIITCFVPYFKQFELLVIYSIVVGGMMGKFSNPNEPRSEKTGLRGFRPGPTQTGLYSHRRWLEA